MPVFSSSASLAASIMGSNPNLLATVKLPSPIEPQPSGIDLESGRKSYEKPASPIAAIPGSIEVLSPIVQDEDDVLDDFLGSDTLLTFLRRKSTDTNSQNQVSEESIELAVAIRSAEQAAKSEPDPERKRSLILQQLRQIGEEFLTTNPTDVNGGMDLNLSQKSYDDLRGTLKMAENGEGDVNSWLAKLEGTKKEIHKALLPVIRGFTPSFEVGSMTDLTLTKQPSGPRHVVVIGGGFCGTHAAMILDRIGHFHVTLIDSKEYFEFTPAMVAAMCKPEIDIRVAHTKYIKNGRFELGYVKSILPNAVKLADKTIPFHYCIVATGSTYSVGFIKGKNLSTIYRTKKLKSEYAALEKAKRIVIVGGGPVGVEIAGEIAEKFPPTEIRKIVLIDGNTKLLKRCPKRAQQLALKTLKKMGVEVILNQRIVDYSEVRGNGAESATKIIKSSVGATWTCDRVFLATGPKPNSSSMKEAFEDRLDASGFIKVNEYLQVVNSDNIFCGGDVANIPEEKLAYAGTAEGVGIARNIWRLDAGKRLIKQGQEGFIPAQTKPMGQVISIGTKTGIFNVATAATDASWLANSLLNQRDISSILPIDRALWYGVSLNGSLFTSHVVSTAKLNVITSPLSVKYQRLILDLYWDAQQKTFQMCPQPYSSAIPSPTVTTYTLTATATVTTRSPSPSPSGADVNINGYICSQSIRTFPQLLPQFSTWLNGTSTQLLANVVFLILNLNDLAVTPNSNAAASTTTLSSSLLSIIGNASMYTPADLASDRADINNSWGFISPYYVTTFDATTNKTSTTNGWPVGQYLTLVGKRLLVGFGSNTISATRYDTSIDANTIFSSASLGSTSFLSTDAVGSLANCSRPTTGISMIGTGGFDSPYYPVAQGTSALSYSFASVTDTVTTPFTSTNLVNVAQCGFTPIFTQNYSMDALASTIWTWEVAEPSNQGRCAVMNKDSGRWAAADCDVRYPVACRSITNPYNWTIPDGIEYYWNGDSLCPATYRFAIPRSPIEATHLHNVLLNTPNIDRLWIDYNSVSLKGCWVVGGNTVCPYYDATLIIPEIIAASLREGLLVVIVGFLFLLWQINRQLQWRRLRIRRVTVRKRIEAMEKEFTAVAS
ncbi:hypothetical protein SmJEL517_g04378 [Synchytrium microbalum]|uniref:Uncharacterized protein n=1 Tax=Synchytrium microbalum TaxID=1806994 RepID=A0A507BZN0_9FUNG|nr:uncharacterized protein SmJEL517_g04378 [Synchytrium microbalum]TPX32568.1 hypothetical protein SmJEL517_g04378 [Synchytrium microbalum]